MLAPLLSEIAREQAGRVRVAKVNGGEQFELAARYHVRAVPTLLFFDQGKVQHTLVGAQSKKNILDRLADLSVKPAA
jgi:thioredoxin 1